MNCQVEKCDRAVSNRGYCVRHYAKLRKYGDPTAGREYNIGSSKKCSVEGCDRAYATKGLCKMHYGRFNYSGSLGPAEPLQQRGIATDERVFSHLRENSNGCWIWNKTKVSGYGYVQIEGKSIRVHRWVYEYLRSEIPRGLVIDHLCLNKACANPWHVEIVSAEENSRRGGRNRGRTPEFETSC